VLKDNPSPISLCLMMVFPNIPNPTIVNSPEAMLGSRAPGGWIDLESTFVFETK
jgi:hypothetical protein